MECKFLDSYKAEMDGEVVAVWHCRKREPFVLGASKKAAMATCSSCRLSDFTRPPAELALDVERRNQELVALNSIVAAVNASLELNTVLSMGLEKVMEILTVAGGWISLVRRGGFELRDHRGLSAAFVESPGQPGGSDDVVTLVEQAGETIVVDDLAAGPFALPAARREGLTTLLGVPLKAQGRLLAVLILTTRDSRSYSADDIYFATAAGAQLAAAIERALLFEEQMLRIERERRLLEAAETVNRSLDSPKLSQIILAEAAHLLGAQRSALLVVRGQSLIAEDVHNLSEEYRRLFILPLADSVSGRAILKAETVAVDDVDDEPQVDAVLISEGAFRSFLTAPLQSYTGTYGAISVYFDDVHEFTDDDRMLLRTFSVQAAIALDNRRLMHEKDQMAVHDGLTGVFNRSYLELTLERTIKESRRSGGCASVLFLDVDDLKAVNDGHGHQAGDRLLQDMAALLAQSCRDSDIVARYGGDEFVVLMPGTGEDGARTVSDKIGAALRQRNEALAGHPQLSASLGMHTASGKDLESLLQEADRAMYAMKRARQRAAGANV